MLYDMTNGGLTRVAPTTFKDEAILERSHLQAAVMRNIAVLGDDLKVVAEEFGEFEDTNRRIDLLCIDKSARLVVIELKRTEGGGHMELQAIRYAAMVSTMGFDELVTHYARHLAKVSDDDMDVDVARADLLQWLDDPDEGEHVLQRQVRIILASANFTTEITTTVLWLNEFYAMDITCMRLTPYRHQGSLLLDVQQVIPLPEAEALMVRLRKRENEVREARTSGADWTPYVIGTPDGETEPLRKRRAVLALVQALAEHGVPCKDLAAAIPHNKLRSVPGELTRDDLNERFADVHGRTPAQLRRWLLEAPLHDDGQTWVLHKMWGTQTEKALRDLVALAPSQFSFRPA